MDGVMMFSSPKFKNSPRQKSSQVRKSLVPQRQLVVKEKQGTVGIG
jgi:hypothetical protein